MPELEQAISLDPEAESHYLSLGHAYLKLGETAKGIETFDKAVKLAPGQRVWNDVAYYLAVSKVQLDRAQQYAESAATEVATDLRNVELERLTMQDLQNVTALAADWDTLGWVHFQKGDIDLAEKYIAAAWRLDEHSEVGYHLGQILEKRGKNEEAIRMYALSVVADRLVPEARESLDRMVGKDKSEPFVKKAWDEIRESRSIKLGPAPRTVKDRAEAQFYVVLTPGPARNAQVTDVKFISGDEKLRPMNGLLKSANFGFVFPDETTTKVIRRGPLFCPSGGGECTFIMLSPSYVTSVD